MKQLLNIILFFIITSSATTFCMNEILSECHRKTFKKITPNTSEGLQGLEDAVTYFTTYANEFPGFQNKCELVTKTIIPHVKRGITFSTLLREERIQADPSRWIEIEPLIDGMPFYSFDLEEELRNELINLSEQEIRTYDEWVRIISEFKLDITSDTEAIAPPLPPLPPLLELEVSNEPLHLPVLLPQTVAPKKQQKVKRKKNTTKKSLAKLPKSKSPSQPKPNIFNPAKQNNPLKDLDLFWSLLKGQEIERLHEFCAQSNASLYINTKHPNEGHTPLTFAVSNKYFALCTFLLEKNADPNITATIKLNQGKTGNLAKNKQKNGWESKTPLSIAVQHGLVEYADLLLQHKADPNIPSKRIPSNKEGHMLCLITKALDSKNSPYTNESSKNMIKLLLSHGVKKFCGTLSFFDTNKNTVLKINLDKPEHQALLPRIAAGINKITYTNRDVILEGIPAIIPTLQEVNKDSLPRKSNND